MKPTVYLGADHAGFDMKETIKEHLGIKGYVVEDLGAHKMDKDDDYPHYAALVAKAVVAHPGSLGILSCGSAEGICIAANKFVGIRAGLGFSIPAAQSMKADDDTNVLCVPGRIETKDDPLAIVETFLTTPFSGAERHKRRIDEIE